MNDYLEALERYKDIKEFADLKDEVKKLREYFHTGLYDKMQQHIQSLMQKYLLDTIAWNSGHPFKPLTQEQVYLNAEAFLHTKFQALVAEKGLSI